MSDLNPQEVLTSEVNAILEEPAIIEIEIVSPGLWDKILFKFGAPTKRKFELKPIVLGNLVRISKRLLTVDMDIFEQGGNILVANYTAIQNHSTALAEIVAIGMTNQREEPSPRLVRFILNNFTAVELLNVVTKVVKMMEIGAFMNTIISAKGMSLLNPGETIASGVPSEG
ncbi:hypothetical protein AAHN97_14980 [Chitinophaga niabensis]|uniref:hypothetical protein n=1 Tax=Chitinophaga niabensis TaxID=536979 RepID=UPI0031BA1913